VHRNCLLKNVIKGKIEERIEVMGGQGKNVTSYLMTLRKERILEIDRRSNRSPPVENALRNWVWTSCRTDY
jgi:hypothetical protein